MHINTFYHYYNFFISSFVKPVANSIKSKEELFSFNIFATDKLVSDIPFASASSHVVFSSRYCFSNILIIALVASSWGNLFNSLINSFILHQLLFP